MPDPTNLHDADASWGPCWVDAIAFASAALAAEPGEAGKLAAWLRTYASEEFGPSSDHPDAARLTRAATLLQQSSAPAPAVVPVAVADALTKAECALADISEGEETSAAPNTVEWAKRRCSEALLLIRPVMTHHEIRTSEWPGADHPDGPWRPIPAPQAGLPWKTDGPAVPEGREPASVAAEASPTPADRLALALCRASGYPGPCHVSEICNGCRKEAAAVIRELADQVVPESTEPNRTTNVQPELDVVFIGAWHIWNTQRGMRFQLLAIGTELEGNHA